MKKEVIIRQTSTSKRYFQHSDSGAVIRCMFRDRACTPDCAGCQIDLGGVGNNDKATCLRGPLGSFTFAEIVNDETDYGD